MATQIATLVQKVEQLDTNMGLLDRFVHGTEVETVQLGGVATPTARNLAKHLTDVTNEAADSATAAAASSTAAHTSEVAAKGSENAAKASETAAAGSAISAAASATSAANSAQDLDAAVDLAQQAVTDAQAAANNINIRKYPASGYVYATPGQTDITPGFTMDVIKDNVSLYIDGLKQGRGAYTFNALTLSLTEPLVGGESIEVISANADAGSVTPTYTELPVGASFAHFATDTYVPAGCVRQDGAEYTRAQFPILYDIYLVGGKLVTCTYAAWAVQVALTGNCAKFALDADAQKFKVPLLKDGDSITQAASASELGKSVKAGLPNFTGYIEVSGCSIQPYSAGGAFSTALSANNGESYQANGKAIVYSMSLANGNPIYGNSTTVTDEQVRLRHFVVLASAQNSASVFDWSNYMAGLAGKANLDMDNLTAVGSTKVANYAMPSQRTAAVSVPASTAATAPAPAAGFIKFVGTASAAGQCIRLSNATMSYDEILWSSAAGQLLTLMIPVRKNDQVRVEYTASTSLSMLFTFAEGAF